MTASKKPYDLRRDGGKARWRPGEQQALIASFYTDLTGQAYEKQVLRLSRMFQELVAYGENTGTPGFSRERYQLLCDRINSFVAEFCLGQEARQLERHYFFNTKPKKP